MALWLPGLRRARFPRDPVAALVITPPRDLALSEKARRRARAFTRWGSERERKHHVCCMLQRPRYWRRGATSNRRPVPFSPRRAAPGQSAVTNMAEKVTDSRSNRDIHRRPSPCQSASKTKAERPLQHPKRRETTQCRIKTERKATWTTSGRSFRRRMHSSRPVIAATGLMP